MRKALKFIELLCSKNKLYFEFVATDNTKYAFAASSPGHDFDFQEELEAVEAALRLLKQCDVFEEVSVSLPELSRHALPIIQFEKFIDENNRAMRLDMEAFDPPLPLEKEFSCLNKGYAKIGPVVICALVTLIGKPLPSDIGGLTLYPARKILERVITRAPNKKIDSSALSKLVDEITEKYDEEFNCVIFFDKNKF